MIKADLESSHQDESTDVTHWGIKPKNEEYYFVYPKQTVCTYLAGWERFSALNAHVGLNGQKIIDVAFSGCILLASSFPIGFQECWNKY